MPYPTACSRRPHLDQNSVGTGSTPAIFFRVSWVFQAQALTFLEQHRGYLASLLSGLITSAASNTYALVHFCTCVNRRTSVCMSLQVIMYVRLCVSRCACRCNGRCECAYLCGCACIYMYNAINPMNKCRMLNEIELILYVLDIPPVGVKFGGNIPWILQCKCWSLTRQSQVEFHH